MSAPLVDQLRDGLRRSGATSGRVLVAVSGGRDSVALLRGLHELADSALPLHTLHVSHGIRPDGDVDAEWVRQLAERLELPFTCHCVDVPALCERTGLGLETAARTARYDIFQQTARDVGAEFVAVAHHAADQAETVLHHILRGSGLAGLRGIPLQRELAPGVRLIRPLLNVNDDDITKYLTEIDQDWRVDVTNVDTAHTRNRIRQQLLPLLEREFNPQVRSALIRLAQQAAEADAVLRRSATTLLEDAVRESSPTRCELDCGVLREAEAPLLRILFHELWSRQGWPRQRMGFADWEVLAGMVSSRDRRTLPGNCDVRSDGQTLIIDHGVD